LGPPLKMVSFRDGGGIREKIKREEKDSAEKKNEERGAGPAGLQTERKKTLGGAKKGKIMKT